MLINRGDATVLPRSENSDEKKEIKAENSSKRKKERAGEYRGVQAGMMERALTMSGEL